MCSRRQCATVAQRFRLAEDCPIAQNFDTPTSVVTPGRPPALCLFAHSRCALASFLCTCISYLTYHLRRLMIPPSNVSSVARHESVVGL